MPRVVRACAWRSLNTSTAAARVRTSPNRRSIIRPGGSCTHVLHTRAVLDKTKKTVAQLINEEEEAHRLFDLAHP